jgi:hypothetical protein
MITSQALDDLRAAFDRTQSARTVASIPGRLRFRQREGFRLGRARLADIEVRLISLFAPTPLR